jgi:hypothetical protein
MQSRYDTQKEDYNREANLNIGLLEELKIAKEEIVASNSCNKAESGAFINAEVNGKNLNLLYLHKRINLPGIIVITPNSPIGQAIKDKSAGDEVVYSVKSKTFVIKLNTIL